MVTPVRRIRPTATPAVLARRHDAGSYEPGKVTVDTMLSRSKETLHHEQRTATVEEGYFPPGVSPAHVRVGNGLTISTAPFETLRLDISVSLPCMPTDTDSTYERASDLVARYLAEEQARWGQSR